MIIEKLKKKKDENIISGVEKKKKGEFLFSFKPSPHSPLSLFPFYQIKKPNTHLPTSSFLSEKKKESHFQSRQSIIK